MCHSGIPNDLSNHDEIEHEHERERDVGAHEDRDQVGRDDDDKFSRASSGRVVSSRSQAEKEIANIGDRYEGEENEQHDDKIATFLYEREAAVRVDYEYESVEGDECGHPGGDVKSEATEKREQATAEVGASGERVAEETLGANEEHGNENENDVDERLTRAQEAHVGAFVERR